MVVIEGEPVCQERARVISRGGKSWAYDPVSKQKKDLGMAILAQRERVLQGNVWLDIYFFTNRSRRVDLDNLIKAFSDAANGVLWKDDSQITKITAFLIRGTENNRPRTEFQVTDISI